VAKDLLKWLEDVESPVEFFHQIMIRVHEEREKGTGR